MNTFNKIYLTAGAAVIGLGLTVASAFAQTVPDYGFASSTDALSGQLESNIVKVLLIFAGLTALGVGVHYIRKWVGKK